MKPERNKDRSGFILFIQSYPFTCPKASKQLIHSLKCGHCSFSLSMPTSPVTIIPDFTLLYFPSTFSNRFEGAVAGRLFTSSGALWHNSNSFFKPSIAFYYIHGRPPSTFLSHNSLIEYCSIHSFNLSSSR